MENVFSKTKRNYWLKMYENFFAVDSAYSFLMGQQNGSDYIVLYWRLCMTTINTNGRLECKIGELVIQYDTKKIAQVSGINYDTVVIGLRLLRQLNLIYEDKEGCLCISNFDKMVGSETPQAQLMRDKREKEKLTSGNKQVTMLQQSYPAVTEQKNSGNNVTTELQQSYKNDIETAAKCNNVITELPIDIKRIDIDDNNINNKLCARTREEWYSILDNVICFDNMRACCDVVFDSDKIVDTVINNILDFLAKGEDIIIGGKSYNFQGLAFKIDNLSRQKFSDICSGFYEHSEESRKYIFKPKNNELNYILTCIINANENAGG